jgi:hypothetical protein
MTSEYREVAKDMVKKILSDYEILLNDDFDINVIALCSLFETQTRGSAQTKVEHIHIAEAIRKIVPEWSLNITSNKDDESILYKFRVVKNVQSTDGTVIPRTIGVSISGDEESIKSSNPVMNVYFCNAINSLLLAIKEGNNE